MILTCGDCGTLQRAAAAPNAVACAACSNILERRTWRSVDLALATASATFLLLWPANVLTLLSASVVGVEQHSVLISSATEVWNEGWPLLAVVLALFLVVLPLVRFGLLAAVLLAVRLDRRPPWLGPAFQQ